MRPLSVIIPSGGARENLRRTLRSIGEQPEGLVEEILVVRDGAAAETDLLEPGSAARVLLTGSPRGPAAARNAGAAATSAPWLVFVDDDVVLAPNALAELADSLERCPGPAALVCTIVPDPALGDNAYLRFAYGGAAHAPAATTRALLDPWLFCTSFCAVRAEDFRRAGGFDEGFRHPGYEDVEFGARLAAIGIELRACETAVGLHLRRMDREWFISRRERLREPLQRLLTLHPALRRAPQAGLRGGGLPGALLRPLWPGLLRLLPAVERLPPRAGGEVLRWIHAVGIATRNER